LALPIDGSWDNEIKIKDIIDLNIGDWESWTTAGGIPQPSDKTVALADLEISTATKTTKRSWLDLQLDAVTSNKTLDELEADQPFPDLPEDSEDQYI
jgi:hypothetical protein